MCIDKRLHVHFLLHKSILYDIVPHHVHLYILLGFPLFPLHCISSHMSLHPIHSATFLTSRAHITSIAYAGLSMILSPTSTQPSRHAPSFSSSSHYALSLRNFCLYGPPPSANVDPRFQCLHSLYCLSL